jgi:hypothetical protein
VRDLFDLSVLGWPQVRDALHVYVLPTTEFVAARRIQLDPIDFCADLLLFLAVHEVLVNGTFTGDLISEHPLV